MLTRRHCLGLVLLLNACTQKTREWKMPERLGEFTRASVDHGGNDTAPADIKERGLVHAMRVNYTGTAPVKVNLYEMRTSSSAFELLQKFRPQPGKVAFHRDELFVVAESSELPQAELVAFTQALQKALL